MRLLLWWVLVRAVKHMPERKLKFILQNHQILKSLEGYLIFPSSNSHAGSRSCFYTSAKATSGQDFGTFCVEITQVLWALVPSLQHLPWEQSKEFLQHLEHSLQVCTSHLYVQWGRWWRRWPFSFVLNPLNTRRFCSLKKRVKFIRKTY